jgi:hypothetical protein
MATGGRGLTSVCCISAPPMLWFPTTFQVIGSATVAPPARCWPLSEEVCATRAQLASTRTERCSFFPLRVLPLRFYPVVVPRERTNAWRNYGLRARRTPNPFKTTQLLKKGEKEGDTVDFRFVYSVSSNLKQNRIERQRNARQRRHESDRTWSGRIINLIYFLLYI